MSFLGTFVRRMFAKGGPALLPVGAEAPGFELQDDHGRATKLASFRGRRVVLWFYPKASTPGCTKQGCAFRDHTAGFAAKDVAILGISFDAPAENRGFAAAQRFAFPLLSDVDRRVGLAYKACDSASDAYPRRITYVIGPDGRIERAIATQEPGAQAGELLATLR